MVYLYVFQAIASNIFLTASEVGVTLKDGYNGNISAKDAGKIGGNMVRKMIQQAENNMIGRQFLLNQIIINEGRNVFFVFLRSNT